ncbi:hypothetical protein L9F63_005107, partial [Diploptera punctata]
MTKDVVNKYFLKHYCIGIITENVNIISYILEDVPVVSLTVSSIPQMSDSEEYGNLREKTSNFDKIMVRILDQRCLHFIIQVSTPEYLIEYFSRSSRRSAVRSNRQYLFLPLTADEIIMNPDASSIFAMKEMAVMPDLVIANILTINKNVSTCCISNTEENNETAEIIDLDIDCGNEVEIEFLTHKYAAPNPEEEIKLGTWTPSLGFSSEVNLYPNKMNNLGGKYLKISAVPDYPPYTILDLNSTPPVYEGVELRFSKEFARLLNFTFQIVVDDDAWWGEVWPNGTGNGMWGMVAMDTVIMGFGATYAWLENYPYLDYSLPYFRSSVRCITPRPKQLPGWMTPILPFNAVMWAAVAISLIITVIALYLVTNAVILLLDKRYNKRKYSSITNNIILAWGLLFLQSPSEDKTPQYAPLRHLITWLMVYFLLVNSIYSGGLSSVLTVPRFEDPINTVADLAKSNMLWSATTDAWVYSIEEATEPDLAHIVHNYKTLSEDELLKRVFRGDTAFAVERLLGGNYALPSYVNDDTVPFLRAMRADIYSGFPVFNLRKSSPFLESLNMLILRLNAAGLLLNYEVQVVREFVGQRVQLALAQNDQVSTDSGPVDLQIAHIQGPLFFLGFGLLAAFVVFTSEIM